ncbi:hypothetical protein D3C78_1493200 [compost metagenome]
MDAFGVALAHQEHDGRGIRRGIMRQAGAPVLVDLAGVLDDGVDIALQRQRHHVGLKAVDNRARLLAGTAMRLLDGDVLTRIGLPLLGEGFVEILVEFTGRVVGHVEQLGLRGGRASAAKCQ